jgi:hypothetical protein
MTTKNKTHTDVFFAFSRDEERLYGLRRALAIYRMVFGQSRQEDLITYLLAQIPEEERGVIVAELQIDLSPGNRTQDGRSSRESV